MSAGVISQPALPFIPSVQEKTMRGGPILKLLINSETNEVIFAEANKGSVDIIFGIMALPMATAVRMVRDLGMGGSLANIFQSIENLDDIYIHPGQNKKPLLQPTRASTPLNRFLIYMYDGDDEPDDSADEDYNPVVEKDDAENAEDDEEEEEDDDDDDEKESDYDDVEEGSIEALFVKCPECKNSGYAIDKRAVCPTCSRHMTAEMQFVGYGLSGSGPAEDGWVNGVTKYMVTDDLVVKPMSAVSTLSMLKDFNIKDITLLQEKEVYLGMKEALMLLNTSFHSKKVLTEVFINNPCKAPKSVVETESS